MWVVDQFASPYLVSKEGRTSHLVVHLFYRISLPVTKLRKPQREKERDARGPENRVSGFAISKILLRLNGCKNGDCSYI